MPTNDGANGANPTGSPVTASPELLALTPEQLEGHPHVQELKKKFSAAHQDMDKTNLSRKELQAEVARLKVLAGEEDTPVLHTQSDPVTKEELQAQVWELKHGNDLELYGDDQYKSDITRGIPKDYALENAKLRYQSNPNTANLARQQSMASGAAAGVRNLAGEDLTPLELEGIAQGLYSKETALKHRELKRLRG